MDLGLAGARALVTGASRGIGRAIATALAAEGARVAGVARGADGIAAWAKSVDGALPIVADLETKTGCERALQETLAAFGGLDILVHNVGGSGASKIADTSDEDFAQTLGRNLWPGFWLARAAIPSLKVGRSPSITFITSIWGKEGGGKPGYNAAKAAEMSLAKSLARELAGNGVRVNSVAPGSILFPGGSWEKRQKADPEGIAAFIDAELPFGRFGRPEEVADVVVFLSSARASWVSGACVVVDGVQSRSF